MPFLYHFGVGTGGLTSLKILKVKKVLENRMLESDKSMFLKHVPLPHLQECDLQVA